MKSQIQVVSKDHKGLLFVESTTPEEGGGTVRRQGQEGRHAGEAQGQNQAGSFVGHSLLTC
ncbi:hypothetical protein [Solidesulfovibrio sp.]